MRGASRASLTEATERLEPVLRSADAAVVGEELLQVLHLLDREHGLRRGLSDPSRDSEQKAQIAQVLLEGKVSAGTLGLVADVVRLRWARPSELADGIEQLAVTATVAGAEQDGRLGELEDELFRFGRVIQAQPELRAALVSRRLPVERKRDLLNALLEGKATAATLRLVTEIACEPRGRSLERGLEEYGRIAAARRQRMIAVVRTAMPLGDDQKNRLAAALSAQYDHEVHLNIELDPSVVGGISIQVGDELIDGTIAGRLEDVRRRFS